MAYSTWQDAWAHLDKQVYLEAQLDTVKLEALCGDASDVFDNRLRLRYEVPFTLALAPEAYAVATKITSRWAAAQYLRNQNQSEGTEEQLWYADKLEQEASLLLAPFEARKAPTDAVVNTAGLVFSPTDGMEDWPFATVDTAAAAVAHEPIFRRSRLVNGATDHW